MLEVNILQQLNCDTFIDFTDVEGEGDFSLPFQFQLDLIASNLTPGPGENQRFCYNILGVGEDNSDFRDLSHFVFSICPNITLEDIARVTVDGVEVEFGPDTDVELFRTGQVDPPTGCPGLKFDFPVDKVGGELAVCFELNEVFDIGAVPVCIFGASETRSGLSICGPACNGEPPVDETCPAEGFLRAGVCVPVDITPFVNELPTTTLCCGDPDVVLVDPEEPVTCIGEPSVRILITQEICVRVPVEIGATSEVGDALINPIEASDEDICTDCNENGNGLG